MTHNDIAGREVEYPVDVYVPNTYNARGAKLWEGHLILPKSGIVGVPYPHFGDQSIIAYYEGNKYGMSNIVTWGDRCYQAADRMIQAYPTVAFAVYPSEVLTRVGTFDGERITILGPDEDNLVYKWLELHERGLNALDDECLTSRLLDQQGRQEHWEP